MIARLDQGARGGLILVSAPAGFGKTSVISSWIAGRTAREPGARAAWLSLHDEDREPVRFLTSLVAAMPTSAPDVGAGATDHLFADVLRVRLHAELPDGEAVLHRRASDWFEQNEFRSEATGMPCRRRTSLGRCTARRAVG